MVGGDSENGSMGSDSIESPQKPKADSNRNTPATRLSVTKITQPIVRVIKKNLIKHKE